MLVILGFEMTMKLWYYVYGVAQEALMTKQCISGILILGHFLARNIEVITLKRRTCVTFRKNNDWLG